MQLQPTAGKRLAHERRTLKNATVSLSTRLGLGAQSVETLVDELNGRGMKQLNQMIASGQKWPVATTLRFATDTELEGWRQQIELSIRPAAMIYQTLDLVRNVLDTQHTPALSPTERDIHHTSQRLRASLPNERLRQAVILAQQISAELNRRHLERGGTVDPLAKDIEILARALGLGNISGA